MSSSANIDISVIIPHKNHLNTLPRLIKSIPQSDRVEVIVVDNQEIPITKNDLAKQGIPDTVSLYHADATRFAGGACNEGIEHAHGKWLLFAGADDFFTEDAFNFYLSKVNSNADIIHTCMSGWNDSTNEYDARGEIYTKMVREYISSRNNANRKWDYYEKQIRFMFHSNCCKLIKREFIEDYHLRFSEVRASNDALFSVMAGFYAEMIEAHDIVTYVATISGNNISRKCDFDSVKSRYLEDLKINKFLRAKKQWRWQIPILDTIKQYGWRKRLKLLRLALKYRQPLLVDFYTYSN